MLSSFVSAITRISMFSEIIVFSEMILFLSELILRYPIMSSFLLVNLMLFRLRNASLCSFVSQDK